eukprot:TRINITY_DN1903_c1_g1_i3.p1 TRINITY_DN1903_c1_g1~~TRINITY_DN1903_c1_g1_i3.p1  ORF type:complete len:155 (+),score=73.67 TRINITY_DN1903_c1_g1_i3:261-725(+)
MVEELLEIVEVVVKKSLWKESGKHRANEMRMLLKSLTYESGRRAEEVKEKSRRILEDEVWEEEEEEERRKKEEGEKKKVEKKEFRKSHLDSLARHLIALDSAFGGGIGGGSSNNSGNSSGGNGKEASPEAGKNRGRVNTSNLRSLAETLRRLNQ